MMSEKFSDLFLQIKNYGIIPAARIEDAANAAPFAKALIAGGLNIAEIKLETEYAVRAIHRISDILPDMLLIAGGVVTEQQIKAAVESGVKVISVARGSGAGLITYCVKNDIPAIAECATAKDIEKALHAGVDVVSLTLLKNQYGIEAQKKLSAEYPNVKFILRGEINGDNISDCLLREGVIACGTSVMCEDEYISEREFAKIKSLTSALVYKMLGFDFSHIVINCENSEQADQYSSKIESIFGLAKTDEGQSVSNAGIMRFMKTKSYGKNGQIALSTNFIDRALFYLKASGKEFIEESSRFDDYGELLSVYLDSIIGGFAFKLVNKHKGGDF